MRLLYKYFPYFSILLVFIIDISLMFLIHSSWNKSMNELIPIKSELSLTRNNISEGHLWFEEIIAGDSYIDIEKDVFNKFDNKDFQNFTDSLMNYEIQQKFYKINQLLKSLNYIVHKRWNNIQQHGIGSQGDQEFDKEFLNTLYNIDKTIKLIDDKIQEELKSKNSQFIYIVFILILVNLFLFYLIFKFTSKQEEYQMRIKEQKEEFQTIFEYAQDGIILIDLEANFVNCNKAFLELTGYSKNEILSKNYIDLTANKDKEANKRVIKTVIKDGFCDNIEKDYIVANNKIITIHMSASLLPDKKRILLLLKNTTALKLLDKQAKLASMGEMIGNIAHQWRQPLSIISISATGLLMQKELNILTDEDFKKACNTIDNNTQFLSRTIDDFKNFIKGDSKSIHFNLKKYTDSFIRLVDSNIKRHHIKIILKLNENINIEGYPNELIQCFMNIFNNSKDAFIENNIPEEDRYIFISQSTEKDKAIITFKDSANGIPENILPRIFESYFTTKDQSKGTGLGLSMSYRLIAEMKGKITASNVKYEYNGKNYTGAEFKIILPNA